MRFWSCARMAVWVSCLGAIRFTRSASGPRRVRSRFNPAAMPLAHRPCSGLAAALQRPCLGSPSSEPLALLIRSQHHCTAKVWVYAAPAAGQVLTIEVPTPGACRQALAQLKEVHFEHAESASAKG